jgi:broad specificity phosphatase PhoE
VNGDPKLDRGLSPAGAEEARGLGRQIAGIAIDICVTSTFSRARETARLALLEADRRVPCELDPALDDVRVGDLEGETIEAYRAWKRGRRRSERFPSGESLEEAALRYAEALERLVERPEDTVLCVCHEVPVRYTYNAALGSDELDRPLHDVANATPYLFEAPALRRAIVRMRELASG